MAEEVSQGHAQASVLTFSKELGKWEPTGPKGGLAKVHLYRNSTTGQYRVVGRNLQDKTIVAINTNLNRKTTYVRATDSFHQWRGPRAVYGINFASKTAAAAFASLIESAIEELKAASSAAAKGGGTDATTTAAPAAAAAVSSAPSAGPPSSAPPSVPPAVPPRGQYQEQAQGPGQEPEREQMQEENEPELEKEKEKQSRLEQVQEPAEQEQVQEPEQEQEQVQVQVQEQVQEKELESEPAAAASTFPQTATTNLAEVAASRPAAPPPSKPPPSLTTLPRTTTLSHADTAPDIANTIVDNDLAAKLARRRATADSGVSAPAPTFSTRPQTKPRSPAVARRPTGGAKKPVPAPAPKPKPGLETASATAAPPPAAGVAAAETTITLTKADLVALRQEIRMDMAAEFAKFKTYFLETLRSELDVLRFTDA